MDEIPDCTERGNVLRMPSYLRDYPLNGTPRRLWAVVLADDPIPAGATCARLMLGT
jgi:hypothetical protein